MGRRPMPTQWKMLAGNPGKRPLNEREPAPPRGVPPRPDTLGPIGQAVWDELVTLLDTMRVLTLADRRALELVCRAYEEYQAAAATIAQEGATYRSRTPTGLIIRARPEVAMRQDAWRRVVKGLIEFGLTPSARTRLATIPEASEDPGAKDKERFFRTPVVP